MGSNQVEVVSPERPVIPNDHQDTDALGLGLHLAFESAYNTYTKRGLPPGPIANPGIESITAVIRPRQTAYLYFVARNDGSGGHAFAETFDEHERNVARYQP